MRFNSGAKVLVFLIYARDRTKKCIFSVFFVKWHIFDN